MLRASLPLLMCLTHLVAHAAEPIPVSYEFEVGGVVRRVVVTDEKEAAAYCCLSQEGQTKVLQFWVSRDEAPVLICDVEEQAVAFDCNRKLAAILSLNGNLSVIDLALLKRVNRYDGHRSRVVCVEQGQASAFIGYESNSIGRMNLATGDVEPLPDSTCTNSIWTMKQSADKRWIAVGSINGEFSLYDLEKKKKVRIEEGEAVGGRGNAVTGISFWDPPGHLLWGKWSGDVSVITPNRDKPFRLGKTGAGLTQEMTALHQMKAIAVADREDVQIMSIDDGRLLAKCQGQRGTIWSLATTGSKLIAGTWRGSVLVWDLSILR